MLLRLYIVSLLQCPTKEYARSLPAGVRLSKRKKVGETEKRCPGPTQALAIAVAQMRRGPILES